MKRFSYFIAFYFCIFCFESVSAQNVGIGTNTPNLTAALEIKDTSRGLLIPRMTLNQRNAIRNPSLGLTVFLLNDSSFYTYRGVWKKLIFEDEIWKLNGNTNTNGKFIGTIDSSDFILISNQKKRVIISPDGKINFGSNTATYPGYTQLSRMNINCDNTNSTDVIHGFVNDDSLYFQSYSFARAYGSYSNPTIVRPNTTLGGITASGYNGNEYISSGVIAFQLDGEPALNQMPGKISFWTTEAGNGTVNGDISQRMVIKSNGNVGIGEYEPKRVLHIKDVMRLEPRSEVPSDASKGDIYFDDAIGTLRFFDGAEWKNCSSASVASVPFAPSNLSVDMISPLMISYLSWTDLSTNENGFKIERKTNDGVFTQIAETSPNVTTFNDSTIEQNTTYTYRVYSFNNIGGSLQYTNQFQVRTAGMVNIGAQKWSNQNLDVTKYRNGDPIPYVSNSNLWNGLRTGAWCWYLNDSANYSSYGRLYNWYAVNDPRGIAPVGWHVPTDAEWTELTNYLGGDLIAGTAMKSTIGWFWGGNGVNSSGFNALPGSYATADGMFPITPAQTGNWWSATPKDTYDAYGRGMIYSDNSVSRAAHSKSKGFSVRVIKD